jgi:hypothetical protein
MNLDRSGFSCNKSKRERKEKEKKRKKKKENPLPPSPPQGLDSDLHSPFMQY